MDASNESVVDSNVDSAPSSSITMTEALATTSDSEARSRFREICHALRATAAKEGGGGGYFLPVSKYDDREAGS